MARKAEKAEKSLWEALGEMTDEQVLDVFNKALARGKGTKAFIEAGVAAGQLVHRGYTIDDNGDEERFVRPKKAA